ncbi:MAG TPA: ABC transporter permease [Candidatus Angelobacter sp.]|jgi:putative ABC transport system permease protein|nr:ABC transporter permease [Candidatus Angelobacter sp.]
MNSRRFSLAIVRILVVVSIALAVGLFVAVGHVLVTAILDPLPFSNSSQLLDVWETRPPKASLRPMTYPVFQELERRSSVFSSVTAFWGRDCIINGKDSQLSLPCTIVSGSFFETLKIQPVLGRAVVAADDKPSAEPVVVLSYGEWSRSFSRDKNVLGKTISIDGGSFQVIGVMPKDFQFPLQGKPSSMYLPLQADFKVSDTDHKLALDKGEHFLRVIARLKPDSGQGAAQSNLTAVMEGITHDLGYERGISAIALPMKDEIAKDSTRIARVAVYGIGFFTVSACLTLFLVMFLREVQRRDALAIRVVFGARRRDFAVLLSRDSIVLGVTGSLLGLALAWVCIEIEKAVFGEGLIQNRLGFKSVSFTIILGVLLASISGIIGTWRVLKLSNLNSAMGNKTSSFGLENVWMQRIVTGLQVCIAITLVALTVGLAATNFKFIKENRGFGSHSVYVIKMKTIGKVQPSAEYVRLLDALQNIPGVSSGAVVALPPFEGLRYTIRGLGDDRSREFGAAANYVSPGYFSTLQVPFVEGRDFSPADGTTGENVAIISKTLADTLWPGQRAIDKTVYTGKGNSVASRIIGVAGDVKDGTEVSLQNPEIYFPYTQSTFAIFNSVVRTTGENGAAAAAAFERLKALHDPVTPMEIDGMDDLISQSQNVLRAEMLSTLLFAGISVMLASCSICGVTWLVLAMRSRELAIRVACGATSSAIFRVLLKTEGVVVMAGCLAGLVLAVFANRFVNGAVTGFVPCTWWQLSAIIAALGGLYSVTSALPVLFFCRTSDFWVPLTSQ